MKRFTSPFAGVGVDDEDAVVGRLEQPPVANLRIPQGRFHPFTLGDVRAILDAPMISPRRS